MININSKDIKVFPSVGRKDEYDETARLMTEHNITNILKSVSAKKGFVISGNSDLEEIKAKAKPLKFILGGYYFEVKLNSNDLNSNLFAGIKVLENNLDFSNIAKYQYLIPYDYNTSQGTKSDLSLDEGGSTSKFKALILSTTQSEVSSYEFNCQLLKAGKIPESLRFKYSTEDILNSKSEDTNIKTKFNSDSIEANKLKVTNTINGTISGNAGSATKLQTARELNLTGDVNVDTISFDGTKNINVTTSIQDDKIKTSHIQSGAVTNDKLQNPSFTIGTTSINLGETVTTVDGLEVNGSISNATKLATPRSIAINGDITTTGNKFDGSADITLTSVLSKDSVSNAKILDNTIENSKLKAKTITADKIADSTITGVKIKDGTITSTKLSSNSISKDKMMQNSVGTDQLVNSSVTADKIANSTITGGKITSNTISPSNLKVTDYSETINLVKDTKKWTPQYEVPVIEDEDHRFTDCKFELPLTVVDEYGNPENPTSLDKRIFFGGDWQELQDVEIDWHLKRNVTLNYDHITFDEQGKFIPPACYIGDSTHKFNISGNADTADIAKNANTADIAKNANTAKYADTTWFSNKAENITHILSETTEFEPGKFYLFTRQRTSIVGSSIYTGEIIGSIAVRFPTEGISNLTIKFPSIAGVDDISLPKRFIVHENSLFFEKIEGSKNFRYNKNKSTFHFLNIFEIDAGIKSPQDKPTIYYNEIK